MALRVVSLAMFAAAAAFIVTKQFRNDFVVDFNWVGRFETAHAWALLAVCTMVASVVVDGLRSSSPSEPATTVDDTGRYGDRVATERKMEQMATKRTPEQVLPPTTARHDPGNRTRSTTSATSASRSPSAV